MRTAALKRSAPQVHVRAGALNDLDALVALERDVFGADCMARATLKRFLIVPTADVLVAEFDAALAGCAITLFRKNTPAARLYSLAVAYALEGCGVAHTLLANAEDRARRRSCIQMRLEVHENNARAIACYRRAGYREFGRLSGYYRDLGDALRFRKPLTRG